ncbi:ParB/RepB/Spo0J family partition protein [Deinococcus cellulosilyticus]|uniref:Chromosome partitioning protein ParB n=1 Tax=Deinococcus cellulosilyticus (strain DSM 18568 / NBRC 106333 / KACC 11606 / 5516J-15) TaxID=1223518 RepID=A0A511MVK1_DEIC1|nr:ParB/RepB/Spo0J family partition protein [Deinococcus cellulosilyticus]GEM44605.1 chromosome partitioning protein ParB [Deinococcus cellulosilyticus NBRC 106333 = KACC 11606]
MKPRVPDTIKEKQQVQMGTLKLGNQISLNAILPSTENPRRHFDAAELEALSESIRQYGVISPITLRNHPEKPGYYRIIAGERRFQAAKAAGLSEIPAYIRNNNDAHEDLERAFIENAHREDLNAYEQLVSTLQILERRLSRPQTEIIKSLQEAYRNAESQPELIEEYQKLTRVVKIPELGTFVTKRLPILNYHPKVLSLLQQGELGMSSAVELNRLKNLPEDEFDGWLKKALSVSSKDLRQKVNQFLAPPRKSRSVSEVVKKNLGTTVKKMSAEDQQRLKTLLQELETLTARYQ